MSIPVKATALGFYGSKLRHEGEEFEVQHEKELGSWMERLDGEDVPAAPKAEKRSPKAAPAAPKAEEGRASDQSLM